MPSKDRNNYLEDEEAPFKASQKIMRANLEARQKERKERAGSMIEKMRRYSFFVFEPEYQHFLLKIRALGVLHIKEQRNPKENTLQKT